MDNTIMEHNYFPPKLNLFALPSQTTLLLILIVSVLLGAVFGGSAGAAPVCIWPLAMGLLLLPWRGFLARPERETARLALTPADNAFQLLKETVERHARELQLPRSPSLLVSPVPGLLFTFGTFRQWFLVMSKEIADQIQKDLQDPENARRTQAVIIHELHHFKNGDYWKIGYVYQLVHTTFLFMSWAIGFILGYGLILVVAAPDIMVLDPPALVEQMKTLTPEMQQFVLQVFPSSEEIAALRQRAAGIHPGRVLNFFFSAVLPFVIVGLILWKFYWPKMWRLREYYADAGTVQLQGDSAPFISALTDILSPALQRDTQPRFKEGHLPARGRIREGVMEGFAMIVQNLSRGMSPLVPQYGGFFGGQTPEQAEREDSTFKRFLYKVRQTLQSLTASHPPVIMRLEAIKNPLRAFDTWKGTALLVGTLTLLLDILLSSPLTLIYVGAWPMHFSTLVILFVVPLTLLPALVLGKPVWKDLLKIITVVVGLRLGWLLLTLGSLVAMLLYAPDLLDEILAEAVAAVARFGGFSDELGFPSALMFVTEAAFLNLAQVFIIFIVLVVGTAGTLWMLRRTLTWYALPRAEQHFAKLAYLPGALAIVFFGLTVLPFLTIALLRPNEFANPWILIVPLMGLVLTGAGLLFFFVFDHRFARKCPVCGERVTGKFILGESHCEAETCRAPLFPWLVADYKV